MPDSRPAAAEPFVESANQALAEGRWADARDLFEQAREEEESGAVHEGLGWVGWWLSDETLTIDSRERAHELFLEEGEIPGAARIAAWLASDHYEYRGDEILARDGCSAHIGWPRISKPKRPMDGWHCSMPVSRSPRTVI